jgi:nicotinamidase-related amidase
VDAALARDQSGLVRDGDGPLLVVVDVQRVFAEDTPWHIPGLDACLPRIVALAESFGARGIRTKHVPPEGGGAGTWRRFYAAWSELDRPGVWDVVPELEGTELAEIPKSVYSCFGAAAFVRELQRLGQPPLVVCGVETDCCVLATVLDAVDEGIPVTVVTDAVTSPSETAHRGALALFERLPEQVELRSTAELTRPTG